MRFSPERPAGQPFGTGVFHCPPPGACLNYFVAHTARRSQFSAVLLVDFYRIVLAYTLSRAFDTIIPELKALSSRTIPSGGGVHPAPLIIHTWDASHLLLHTEDADIPTDTLDETRPYRALHKLSVGIEERGILEMTG